MGRQEGSSRGAQPESFGYQLHREGSAKGQLAVAPHDRRPSKIWKARRIAFENYELMTISGLTLEDGSSEDKIVPRVPRPGEMTSSLVAPGTCWIAMRAK